MRRALFALACAAAVFSGGAVADARLSLGFSFGVPLYWGPPAYYYPPYYPYYYPPPVIYAPSPVITAPPPAMVERPVQPETAYWYYCAAERGYYPYVRDCPGGWERVPAAPPPGR